MRPSSNGIGVRALAFVALLCSVVLPTVEGRSPPREALVSPGPDTDAVVAFLKRIQSGRAQADSQLANVLMRGRLSLVTKDWKEGTAEQTPQTMPPPEWRQFLLVQKRGKRRYEQEHPQITPRGSSLAKVYRLMDGESLYKLDLNALEILGNKNEKERWEDLTYDRCIFGQVHDGLRYAPLTVVCQVLIDRMTKGLDSDYWARRVLRCYEQDGLLVVENDDKEAGRPSRYHFVCWVDPRKGYRVVKTVNQQGGPGRGSNYWDRASVELAEVLPGVFAEKKATYFTQDTGSTAKKDGRAGWTKRDLEVSEVLVEDFDYSDDQLNWRSLPIPVGAHVTDNRHDPPLTFSHGIEPLDEETLQAGLRNRPPTPRRGFQRLWMVNLLILGVLGVWVVARRWRRAGQQA